MMVAMKRKWIWTAVCFIWLGGFIDPAFAQSIADKKANVESMGNDLDEDAENFLQQLNRETQFIHKQIEEMYEQAWQLYHDGASPIAFHSLLDAINDKRTYLQQMEKKWREMSANNNRLEGYGLWHAPETTLEQLVIDYGSQDYVYLIPPEVGSIRLSINSNLPIPRAAWSSMLETILTQNGVGIKELNPYLRQLFLLKQDRARLLLITNRPEELQILPPQARIGFMLTPPQASDVRRTYDSLEKLSNPNTTSIQSLGRDIFLTGQVRDIQDLLQLYHFIDVNRGEKEYRLIPVFKIPSEAMGRILAAMFDQMESGMSEGGDSSKGNKNKFDLNGLKIIPLPGDAQALFLVGTCEEITKAEEVVRSVESQIGGARDKTVFWYTVKHSEAEVLADVLYRVYLLMASSGANMDGAPPAPKNVNSEVTVVENNTPPPPPIFASPYNDNLYGGDGFVVNPAPAQPGVFKQTNPNRGRDNFIVDAKTGSIIMVVEADILPKIKDLVRKLDVPKKMVQIETLLFEKVLSHKNSFGLNLLRVGEHLAHSKNLAGAFFNNITSRKGDAIPSNRGVFEFFISSKGGDCSAPFDLAYRFLLSQDDIQINSCPSITTVNQTPATISVNEDISINTGIFEVETNKGVTLKDAYARAQYGITISINPTIHTRSEHDGNARDYDYVTLETDITFDTIHPGGDKSRPDVTRRHIKSTIEVVDGESAIIGGLRRKISNDAREGLPFLCELPGVGKLFGYNTMNDSSTEMFIFLTPHIIKDPKDHLACLRQKLLCLRPGDIPAFLECVEEAHRCERSRLMEGSLSILFGRPTERYYVLDECECGEYDGR